MDEGEGEGGSRKMTAAGLPPSGEEVNAFKTVYDSFIWSLYGCNLERLRDGELEERQNVNRGLVFNNATGD